MEYPSSVSIFFFFFFSGVETDTTLFERVQAPIGGEENLKKERKMGQGSCREKKEDEGEKKTKCYIS